MIASSRGTQFNGNNNNRKIIVEWALGGHSMGGYAALQLGGELLQIKDGPPSVTLRDGSSISRVSNQIVAWAAGNAVNSVPNLQRFGEEAFPLSSLTSFLARNEGNYWKNHPLRVLILLASNDDIAKFASEQQRQDLLSKLPPKTTYLHTIEGGNHAGFASYNDALMDGPRDIPLEVQHVEACSKTVHFILEK